MSFDNIPDDFLFTSVGKIAVERQLNQPLLHASVAIGMLFGYLFDARTELHYIRTHDEMSDIFPMVFDARRIGELRLRECKMTLPPRVSQSQHEKDNQKIAKVFPKEFFLWARKYKRLDTSIFSAVDIDILKFIGVIKKPATPPPPPIATTPYTTEYTVLMTEAIKEFWEKYNPDTDSAPLKKHVVDWLLTRATAKSVRLSDNLANSMDSLIRHKNARDGGIRRQ